MKNKLKYTQAPLPFQGQKRRFVSKYAEVIGNLPDDTIFVDLFGGSGLLSRASKDVKPNSTVIYNDYDNYSRRIAHIEETNLLLRRIRHILQDYPRNRRLAPTLKEKVLDEVSNHAYKYGYVDYITLSASILFSMKYANDLEELRQESLYNSIKRVDYSLSSDYLRGLVICRSDYKDLFLKHKDNPKVFFICDPPYLSTNVGTYTMSWKLRDYLGVLQCLRAPNIAFFTSTKTSIIELLEWLDEEYGSENPLKEARCFRTKNSMNFNAVYEDIMLVKMKEIYEGKNETASSILWRQADNAKTYTASRARA